MGHYRLAVVRENPSITLGILRSDKQLLYWKEGWSHMLASWGTSTEELKILVCKMLLFLQFWRIVNYIFKDRNDKMSMLQILRLEIFYLVSSANFCTACTLKRNCVLFTSFKISENYLITFYILLLKASLRCQWFSCW